jgi:WXG100 family type VII secretion target
MRTEVTAAAAQFLADQAEELNRELSDITESWADLSATWVGIAGAAYEPIWDEWHQDAVTVSAVLVEHSEALVRAVALLVEHERGASAKLTSIGNYGRSS